MGKQIDADKLIEHFINKTSNGWLVSICENESRWTLEGIISEIKYFKPTIEAIPKDQYEQRLKADMVAILTDLYMEIEELDTPSDSDSYDAGIVDCEELIQEKIDALKKNKEEVIAVLTEIQLEMQGIKECEQQIYGKESWNFVGKCQDAVQQRIDKLRGGEDENEKLFKTSL